MLNDEQKNQIRELIISSLTQAENIWERGGYLLEESYSTERFSDRELSYDSMPSRIPGHSVVDPDLAETSNFIAIVADMRDSTKHLLIDISEKKAKVTQIQRIFYETSALLPALEKTIQFEGGSVTEYLGDGVLGFFKADDELLKESIYSASRAAQNCIGDTRKILNKILYERYQLPSIDIGIGLAYSKCLISALGIKGNEHPKAFGRCVYDATKLSGGRNEIYVQENLADFWPTVKQGRKAAIYFGKVVEKGKAKGRKLNRNIL